MNDPGLGWIFELDLRHVSISSSCKSISRAKTYLEPPQQARNDLVNLQQTDVLANASPGTHTELQHDTTHLFDSLLLGLFSSRSILINKPSLRPENIDILTENLAVVMHYPGGNTDNGTAFDEMASDLRTRRWHDPLQWQSRRRMHAERFLDTSIQVWQSLTFAPRHNALDIILEMTFPRLLIKLLVQLLHAPRVLKQVVEDTGQGDGGRFAAGEGHAHGHGHDEGVGHEFGAVGLGLDEFREEVWLRHGFGLGGWEDGFLAIFLLGETLCHALLCETGDGEGGVDESVSGGQEVDGILEEEEIEEGNLSDLGGVRIKVLLIPEWKGLTGAT